MSNPLEHLNKFELKPLQFTFVRFAVEFLLRTSTNDSTAHATAEVSDVVVAAQPQRHIVSPGSHDHRLPRGAASRPKRDVTLSPAFRLKSSAHRVHRFKSSGMVVRNDSSCSRSHRDSRESDRFVLDNETEPGRIR